MVDHIHCICDSVDHLSTLLLAHHRMMAAHKFAFVHYKAEEEEEQVRTFLECRRIKYLMGVEVGVVQRGRREKWECRPFEEDCWG